MDLKINEIQISLIRLISKCGKNKYLQEMPFLWNHLNYTLEIYFETLIMIKVCGNPRKSIKVYSRRFVAVK